MGIRTAVKQVLIAQQDRKYEKELAQLKVTYEQWAAEQERATNPEEECSGIVEFVIFRQAAGRLADNATERINAYFVKHPEAEIVYGDEDLMNEKGERCIPWYKPCWSPDLYRAFFYVGSVVAVRSSLLQRMGENPVVTENESTGKEIIFTDAGEIRPLMDRLFLGAGGFERLSFHRSYGKRVIPWNFFCRRNRNPGTGCTCRPGQPGVHSLGKLPADEGVTAAGGGTGLQGGGRCQRVVRRRA